MNKVSEGVFNEVQNKNTLQSSKGQRNHKGVWNDLHPLRICMEWLLVIESQLKNITNVNYGNIRPYMSSASPSLSCSP